MLIFMITVTVLLQICGCTLYTFAYDCMSGILEKTGYKYSKMRQISGASQKKNVCLLKNIKTPWGNHVVINNS